jgi:hypothetical protein
VLYQLLSQRDTQVVGLPGSQAKGVSSRFRAGVTHDGSLQCREGFLPFGCHQGIGHLGLSLLGLIERHVERLSEWQTSKSLNDDRRAIMMTAERSFGSIARCARKLHHCTSGPTEGRGAFWKWSESSRFRRQLSDGLKYCESLGHGWLDKSCLNQQHR